jgi:hypothetical protein
MMSLAALAGGAAISVEGNEASGEQVEAARAAVAEFEAALAAHASCIGGASVSFVAIGNRGEYRPDLAAVWLDTDLAVSAIRLTLIHELAHHATIYCGAISDPGFTAAFYQAQGLPLGRGWVDYSHGWAATPIEQLAEAVTKAITGGQNKPVPITPEGLAVVSAWMAGEPLPLLSPVVGVQAPPAVSASPPRVHRSIPAILGWGRRPSAF